MLKRLLLLCGILIIALSLSVAAVSWWRQFRENGVSLSRQYNDAKAGFRFNYPDGARIYEFSVNDDRWIRVFTKGAVGPSCDLSVDPQGEQENPKDAFVVKLGLYEWVKTRADRGFFGGIYDAHGARWRLNSRPVNFIWDTGSLEYEPLCERIIRTFRVGDIGVEKKLN